MSRYIDADKVLKELRLNHNDVIYIDKRDTAKRIEKIQGIDIVRCKECKKANTEDCSTSWYDDDWGVWRIGYMGDNWYCADGEREGE